MITQQPRTSDPSSPVQLRLAEAEDTLSAIRQGEIDALVVEGPAGHRVYTLHSADEPYRTLVEQMQEGAVVLDGLGRIVYANARFAALVGERLESVVGNRLDVFVHASDREDVEALIGRGSGRCRSRLICSDSQSVEVSLSLATTRSVAGNRLNLIVTDLSDLLEAHHLRERAERDSRTKDEFLAVFAHELRNPLAAISSAAGLLKSRDDGVGRPARAFDVIARQIGHMSHLVDDLLDVERVAAGKLRLNRQPVDLEAAIRQSITSFTVDPTVDRQISISTEPVWVDCDAVRLRQVLTNLVSNAVKYTPSGGQIRVTLHAEDGDAVLSVEDTGFGISPTLLPFIFDLYVQVDRTLDYSQKGLGIGLALVRRLVELHGGTVVASSDGEGQGSRFTVRLKQMAAPTHLPAAVSPPERRSRQRRVLLFNDSGQARERLRTLLELAGHLVYDAPDVGSGLELVKTVRPDVAVIDIGSPIVDCRRVAKRIREEPHGRTMTLVAIGRTERRSNASGPPEDGFDFHLTDPVDAERLVRLVDVY